jgi:transposase
MDEVHFQQHGSRCRMWIAPEVKDPVLLHHPTRKSVKYFGAVRIRDGRFVFRREEDSFDAVTCHAFLRQLWQAARRSGRRVVIIADNAGYHHARLHRPWRQARAHRLRLHFIPPYSPELNPIERVWKLTRRRRLHNRYFPQLEAVAHAVEDLFAEWSSGNHTLRRLCAIT